MYFSIGDMRVFFENILRDDTNLCLVFTDHGKSRDWEIDEIGEIFFFWLEVLNIFFGPFIGNRLATA
jgi:hypothetical protein